MTKKGRRDFLWDAAKLLMVPAAATIMPATLEDILDLNNVQAQQPAAAASTTEQLSYTIHLRNFDTRSVVLGRLDDSNVGVATFTITHTPTAYRIVVTSRIDVRRPFIHSWVRLNSMISGAFSNADGTPQFQPQYYWFRYEEGGTGTTPKLFLSDIHFDFDRYQARSYGYHHEEGLDDEEYGSRSSRMVEPIASSTRDIISAIMEARFQPVQRRRQINTVISGRSEGMWFEHLGRRRFQPARGRGYPTNMFRLYFRPGILPEAHRSYNLMMEIHEGGDRTPVTARHIKSEGSEVHFVLRDHSSKLTGRSLYPTP